MHNINMNYSSLKPGSKFRMSKGGQKYTVDKKDGTVIHFSSENGTVGKIDLKYLTKLSD